MFRPKKYLKLDLLEHAPSINDLQEALGHAQKLRGCTIELPWHLAKAQAAFALAVRIEVGSEESLWTLYTGEGNKSRVLWSAPFSDISLLNEVISLSLAEVTDLNQEAPMSTSTVQASPDLKPDLQKEKETEKLSQLETKKLLEEKLFKDENIPVSEQLSSPGNEIALSNDQGISQNPNYFHPNNSQTNMPVMPAQNFYPHIQQGASGGFPVLPPPNAQTPIQYYYYYPGYPYPIPMPYPPPGSPMSQPVAGSVPLQSGMPILDSNASSSRLPAPDAELLRKKTNYMIGQFLVDSNLITESTLKTALKLQEMVIGNVISPEQAYEAINKIHNKGGNLDIAQLIKESPTSGNTANAPKQNHPLIGDLLVKGQIIGRSLLEAVLKMQEIVRAGAITKDEACQAIIKELAALAPKKQTGLPSEFDKELRVMDLLLRCSLISVQDKETALGVQKKHGGQLGQILVSAGKIHLKTYLAAVEGETLLRQNKAKLEQVIIALNYCARTRINLSEAFKELGFSIDK